MSSALQIARYKDLVPCRSAFIDAHTPGSDQKENYTVIGAGVSESPDQVVHIKETPGFNIGAAAQPAHCTNSLHAHRTAEVFVIYSGTWDFYWGMDGKDGNVVLAPGDIISLPTHMFRGFRNISETSAENPNGYGFMFAILGGDDAGGGVEWAPQVLDDAQDHGLVLLETGGLIDTKKGQTVPKGLTPKAQLTAEEIAFYSQNSIESASQIVIRKSDWINDSVGKGVALIGAQDDARIREKPGFEVDSMTVTGDREFKIPGGTEIFILISGSLDLTVDGVTQSAVAGDTLYAKGSSGAWSNVGPNTTVIGVRPTQDPAGKTVYC